jgi:GNAT superfamily N-acetyltransferase
MKNNIISELMTFPNQAIIWEIIDTGKTGKIINLSEDAVLIIENCDEPFAFIAGKILENEFVNIISVLKQYKDPAVYCNPIYHPLFLKAGYDFHLRAELNLNKLIKITLSENIRVEKINTSSQCKINDLKVSISKYNHGYALFANNQLVSEAYVTIGKKWGELSIFTHPDYRKKGYAKYLLAHLIEDCLIKKITPIWSCQVDNKASLYTALSLGFTISRYYTLLVPEWGNVLCPNLARWIRKNNYP